MNHIFKVMPQHLNINQVRTLIEPLQSLHFFFFQPFRGGLSGLSPPPYFTVDMMLFFLKSYKNGFITFSRLTDLNCFCSHLFQNFTFSGRSELSDFWIENRPREIENLNYDKLQLLCFNRGCNYFFSQGHIPYGFSPFMIDTFI